eukprot:scaffold466_cov104-Skeletonema_marinoi.AAC.3
MPHQVSCDVVATPIQAKVTIRSFYTIMANYDGSLEAVDRHIHSVRYDMVLESISGSRLRCLIRSPTTL